MARGTKCRITLTPSPPKSSRARDARPGRRPQDREQHEPAITPEFAKKQYKVGDTVQFYKPYRFVGGERVSDWEPEPIVDQVGSASCGRSRRSTTRWAPSSAPWISAKRCGSTPARPAGRSRTRSTTVGDLRGEQRAELRWHPRRRLRPRKQRISRPATFSARWAFPMTRR
jgi:hypothetical protein